MERLTERAEVDKCPGIWVKEDFANKGIYTFFNGYDEGYSAINKCTDYEDLEEQGLLIRLPCKAGTTVYEVIDDCAYDGNCHTKRRCNTCGDRDIHIEQNVFQTILEIVEHMGDFGKTVFLTQAEAEEALQKMNKTEEANE